MKTLTLALVFTLSFLAETARASEYSCASVDGSTLATLKVLTSSEITWDDETHAASSLGIFKGIETAPFSSRKGEFQFALVDFFRTEDQQFLLSLPANILSYPDSIQITEYFDNDDVYEQETVFNCELN
jgi:hypothetical protein